jgi:hypothetical protein
MTGWVRRREGVPDEYDRFNGGWEVYGGCRVGRFMGGCRVGRLMGGCRVGRLKGRV